MYLCKRPLLLIIIIPSNKIFNFWIVEFCDGTIFPDNSGLFRENCFIIRVLSRRKIESLFGYFTKFNIRITDLLQNSISEKWTFHNIQYQQKGPFTKFNIWKTDPSQNSISEKQTLHKIHYQKNGLITKFNTRKTDS